LKTLVETNCSRIILEGRTSFGIQGINLREKIEETIKQPKNGKPLDVKGRVRNLKDGKVEIICMGSEVELLYETLVKWCQDHLFGIKKVTKEEVHDPEAIRFTDFTVERSDDLSEMVWALRGAGYRFVQSTEKLQEMIDRDKEVVRGKLLTLHYEVVNNRKVLDELTEMQTSTLEVSDQNWKNRVHLEVLNSNLASPIISGEPFVSLLTDIFYELNELRQNGSLSGERLVRLTENLSKLQEMVGKELSDKYGWK